MRDEEEEEKREDKEENNKEKLGDMKRTVIKRKRRLHLNASFRKGLN
jgi:hypothetical protein